MLMNSFSQNSGDPGSVGSSSPGTGESALKYGDAITTRISTNTVENLDRILVLQRICWPWKVGNRKGWICPTSRSLKDAEARDRDAKISARLALAAWRALKDLQVRFHSSTLLLTSEANEAILEAHDV